MTLIIFYRLASESASSYLDVLSRSGHLLTSRPYAASQEFGK